MSCPVGCEACSDVTRTDGISGSEMIDDDLLNEPGRAPMVAPVAMQADTFR